MAMRTAVQHSRTWLPSPVLPLPGCEPRTSPQPSEFHIRIRNLEMLNPLSQGCWED